MLGNQKIWSNRGHCLLVFLCAPNNERWLPVAIVCGGCRPMVPRSSLSSLTAAKEGANIEKPVTQLPSPHNKASSQRLYYWSIPSAYHSPRNQYQTHSIIRYYWMFHIIDSEWDPENVCCVICTCCLGKHDLALHTEGYSRTINVTWHMCHLQAD